MPLSRQQQQCLKLMGIQQWLPRQSVQPPLHDAPGQTTPQVSAATMPVTPTAKPQATAPVAASTTAESAPGNNPVLASLRQQVADCTACELHKGRQQTVFARGNEQADFMVVGEAPGAEEDRQGKPFVGRAGKLLDNMLQSIQLDSEQVYIANIIKCRPANNRDPQADEIQSCMQWLQQQIDAIQPKMILAVGRIAAQSLLQSAAPVGKMRGKQHSLADSSIPVVVTYHPAYLLRKPIAKKQAWSDLILARRVYTGEQLQ